ncbi:c-type cytochrome [Nitrospira sp. Kam-Ns4a]
MCEFLWFLILVASLVGALARPTEPVAPVQAAEAESWCDRLRRRVPQWRWWLMIAVLLLIAMAYAWNNVTRAALNLLLFFERHNVALSVFLALSLIGFVLAVVGDWTVRRLVALAVLAGGVAFLLITGQDCLFYALVLLALFGLTFAQRDGLPRGLAWFCVALLAVLTLALVRHDAYKLAAFAAAVAAAALLWAYWPRGVLWTSVLLTTFLAAGLFLARVFHGPLWMAYEPGDYVIMAIVIGVGSLGLLWAIGARLPLLGWASGLLLVLFVGGLGWTEVELMRAKAMNRQPDVDVPAALAAVADYVLFILLLGLVWSAIAWVRRLPLQPLGWVSAVMIVFLGSGLFFSSILYGQPEDFADIEDQFKYGSIGSDHFMARGIPYYVWEILPQMPGFEPETVIRSRLPAQIPEAEKRKYRPRYGIPASPDAIAGCRKTTRDEDRCKGLTYEAFGLVREKHKTARLKGENRDVAIDRPIGFSKRRVFGMDFVGINCAFCHVSTIREDGLSRPRIVLGMPANTTDIELFFQFLFGAAEREGFSLATAGQVMGRILEKHPELKFGITVGDIGIRGVCQEIKNSVTRFTYRLGLIPLTGLYARRLKEEFYFIDPHNPDRIPRFGPGRVDAWNPGKRTLVNPPLPVEYPGGIIDHTSIWNQKAREGMQLHWDGNIHVLAQRNIIAGLVVNGPQIEVLDTDRLDRINKWIEGRPAPRFDDFVPAAQVQEAYRGELVQRRERGREIFQHWCAACHAAGGERTGRVEPLDGGGTRLGGPKSDGIQLDTDPARLLTFTAELAEALNRVKTDRWALTDFKAQKGYVNMLLDGIWLRAPYLHNGSVPTLRDLLNTQAERPVRFCRGIDVYDWHNVGFVTTTETPDCRGSNGEQYFLFDTTEPGNSNRGHLYGTDLKPDEKDLLIEFLKTL